MAERKYHDVSKEIIRVKENPALVKKAQQDRERAIKSSKKSK